MTCVRPPLKRPYGRFRGGCSQGSLRPSYYPPEYPTPYFPVPHQTPVRLLCTSTDVIHSFALPVLGIKSEFHDQADIVVKGQIHDQGDIVEK
jgi:hypothetical protein